MIIGNAVTLRLAFYVWTGRFRNSRPKAAMRPPSVVMCRPILHDPANVPFAKRNHEVQTLPAGAADQAFTERICLGRSIRRPQHAQSERLQRRIEIFGVDTVSIMD